MADTTTPKTQFLASADGTRLVCRAWPLPQARITFAVVHGLGEHSGRYERFAQGMARHGMATYAVDLRGHGESAGRRGHIDAWSQWVDDAATFIDKVRTDNAASGTEVVPVGHSFGGVVMLSAVRAGRLQRSKRFILSNPALRVKARVPRWKTSLAAVMSSIAPSFTLDNEVDPSTVSRIPEVVEAYRSDPLVHGKISARLYVEWQRAAADNLRHAGEIDIPFLILAGSADSLIDSSGSKELHERAPAMSDLRMLEGRYHEPFNDLGSDDVFALIADWVARTR